MHQSLPAALAAAVAFTLLPAAPATAQTAGRANLGVTVEQQQLVINGWSVKKTVLGKTVFNERNERVGTIADLIVAPDTSVSFAIVRAGGFVGIGRHDVAVPIQQFQQVEGKIVLPGATRDAVKSLPEFEYDKPERAQR